MLLMLSVCGQVNSQESCGNDCIGMALWTCNFTINCGRLGFVPTVRVLFACESCTSLIALLQTDIKCRHRLMQKGLWGTLPSFSDMRQLEYLFVAGTCPLCSQTLRPHLSHCCVVCAPSGSLHMLCGFRPAHSPVTLGSLAHLHYPIGPARCAHAGIFPATRSQDLCRRATATSPYSSKCMLVVFCAGRAPRPLHSLHTPPLVSGHRFALSVYTLSHAPKLAHSGMRAFECGSRHSLLPLRTISYHCLVCVSSGSLHMLCGFKPAHSPVILSSLAVHTWYIRVNDTLLPRDTPVHYPIARPLSSHSAILASTRSQVLCPRATAASTNF